MTRRVHIFVCGIRTMPGSVHNWTGKAVTWCHVRLGEFAEKIEYFTPAILRPFGQRGRAHKLQRTLAYYFNNDFEVTLTGHSNGCDVIQDALTAMVSDIAMPIKHLNILNLISPACVADANVNGLNEIRPWIPNVNVFIATKDRALAMAGTSLGRLLGYGTMGHEGIRNAHFQYRTYKQDIGHSGWFDSIKFCQTMKIVTGQQSEWEAT